MKMSQESLEEGLGLRVNKPKASHKFRINKTKNQKKIHRDRKVNPKLRPLQKKKAAKKILVWDKLLYLKNLN